MCVQYKLSVSFHALYIPNRISFLLCLIPTYFLQHYFIRKLLNQADYLVTNCFSDSVILKYMKCQHSRYMFLLGISE